MVHGGLIFQTARELGISPEELLDFSANLNPLGMPGEIKDAVIRALSGASHYPDVGCGPLREAIADAEQVPSSWVLCGNGAADLVFRLGYAMRPKSALVMAPTFLEYERAMEQAGARVEHFTLDDSLRLDESVLDAVKPGLSLLFLCNPNNPTGILTERGLVERLINRAASAGVLVVLDECFMDFVERQEEYTMTGRLKDFKNLLILKSFTKMYAMAGLRLGYCLSSNGELLKGMENAGQDWSVNTLAQAAGLAALKLEEFPSAARRLVGREREYLKKELEGLSLRVYDSQANYLLFRAPGQEDLAARLLPLRIMIRNCGNYPGLSGDYYRVAVRNHEENERLARALARVLTEGGK